MFFKVLTMVSINYVQIRQQILFGKYIICLAHNAYASLFNPECPIWRSSMNVLIKDAQSRTGSWTSGSLSSRGREFFSVTCIWIHHHVLNVRNGAFMSKKSILLTRMIHVKSEFLLHKCKYSTCVSWLKYLEDTFHTCMNKNKTKQNQLKEGL